MTYLIWSTLFFVASVFLYHGGIWSIRSSYTVRSDHVASAAFVLGQIAAGAGICSFAFSAYAFARFIWPIFF